MKCCKITAVTGAVLLAALMAQGPASAHPEEDFLWKSHDTQGWMARGEYYDEHPGAHASGVKQTGKARVVASVFPPYTLQVKASLSTPLSGLVRATAKKATGPGAIGYVQGASAEQVWGADPVDACGFVYLAYGSGSNTGRFSAVGHKKTSTTSSAQASLAEPLVSAVKSGGIPEREVDPNTGEWEIALDGNGDIIWEVPPTVEFRLTSTLTESGGVFTYTYKVENLDGESRDFVIPEVTTPSFPSGWFGTVAASSYGEISLNTTDEPYSQNATLTVIDNDPDYPSDQTTTGVVYVPESRLVFGGTNTIGTAYYDSVKQANVIRFTASEDAALALLLRVRADGEDNPDQVENVLAGLAYDLEDYNFVPGADNDYRVRTGSGVNGWEQTGVTTISN